MLLFSRTIMSSAVGLEGAPYVFRDLFQLRKPTPAEALGYLEKGHAPRKSGHRFGIQQQSLIARRTQKCRRTQPKRQSTGLTEAA